MSGDTAPASQSTALDFIPRRGCSSLAWRWFGFEKTDIGQKTPICKLCKKAVAVKENSTTNLFHHLRTSHRKDYEEYEKLREPAVIDKPETTNVSDHTGELIAQGLQDALASWSLREDRMVCMTTDSGANVVSALRINKWKRLPCFGHRLHVAIEIVVHCGE
ncbi:hypothetical protein SRHO_G00232680 [Serrasalmus rhombeus]